MNSVPVPKQICTERNFAASFIQDLKRANAFCFIESPYATVDGVSRFSAAIKAAVSRGVRVCAFIQRPRGWDLRNDTRLEPAERARLKKTELAVDLLEALGVHVNMNPGLHVKMIVIDYIVTWGGSMNFLSYTMSTDEEALRWDDPSWARQSANRRGFRRCRLCSEITSGADLDTSVLTADIRIGKAIASARKSADLTQTDLARLVGVSRETISKLEAGQRFPRVESLIQILHALDNSLVVVPSNMKDAVSEWIELSR